MATYIPAPSFSAVPGYQSVPFVSGYEIKYLTTTTFSVAPGCARALCNDNVIQFPSFSSSVPSSITVDVSTVGVNGCYPVSIASLGISDYTMFPVYVISSSSGVLASGVANTIAGGTTTVAGPKIVVATGNNFLPAGYDTYVRIGWVYIKDTDSTIIEMTQSGHGNERVYILSNPFVALSGGNDTSATVVDLSAADGPVPKGKNIEVILNAQIIPNAADGYVYLESGLATAAAAMPTQIFGSVASKKNSSVVRLVATPNATTGNAEVKYLVDAAGSAATLNVIGFVDSLANAIV